MGKILSFVTLVLVTGAFGVLFFEVTSTLLLPLFLAMVSVVMFRPLHTWCERLLRGRNRVAAVIAMTHGFAAGNNAFGLGTSAGGQRSRKADATYGRW